MRVTRKLMKKQRIKSEEAEEQKKSDEAASAGEEQERRLCDDEACQGCCTGKMWAKYRNNVPPQRLETGRKPIKVKADGSCLLQPLDLQIDVSLLSYLITTNDIANKYACMEDEIERLLNCVREETLGTAEKYRYASRRENNVNASYLQLSDYNYFHYHHQLQRQFIIHKVILCPR
eukprot:gene5634-10850_t